MLSPANENDNIIIEDVLAASVSAVAVKPMLAVDISNQCDSIRTASSNNEQPSVFMNISKKKVEVDVIKEFMNANAGANIFQMQPPDLPKNDTSFQTTAPSVKPIFSANKSDRISSQVTSSSEKIIEQPANDFTPK